MRTKLTKMDISYLNLTFLQLHHLRNPTLNRPKSQVKVAIKFFFLSVYALRESKEVEKATRDMRERVYAHGVADVRLKRRGPLYCRQSKPELTYHGIGFQHRGVSSHAATTTLSSVRQENTR